MPEVGLEPTLAEANTALNRARLPIPPLRQREAWSIPEVPSEANVDWDAGRSPYFDECSTVALTSS